MAIQKLLDKLPPAERKMLPEVQQTADSLYERAMRPGPHPPCDGQQPRHRGTRVDRRADRRPGQGARRSGAGPTAGAAPAAAADDLDLRGRKSQVASHLESCVLAMQNVRFDLLRLRSAGVAAVLGDLTQATQQAKALSRDVDNAIAAAGEIREAMK